MGTETPAAAPRFRAYWERVEGTSVFTMSRPAWQGMRSSEGEAVRIDVEATPMGGVARDGAVVAAVVAALSTAEGEIAIYRYDERDRPFVYNVDKYSVWEQLPDRLDYPKIVGAASTEDNENLRRYLRENVFIVKKDRDPDHWLRELPETVLAMMRSIST